MNIQLSQIKSSPNPIRKSWDKDKLSELVQSIKEQGLIVPIKVRPIEYKNGIIVDDTTRSGLIVDTDVRPVKYEIVYGHRRVEAARQAGLIEVECIVEGVNDNDTLIQALIENVVREDMNDADKGEALKKLKEITRKTWEQIGEMFGHSHDWAIRLAGIDDVEASFLRSDPEVAFTHIREARKAGNYKEAVLKKTQNEGLSTRQVGKVAESIASTKDPRRREALLNTPYSSFIHDPDINKERSDRYGENDPLTFSKTTSDGEEWAMSDDVKMVLDFIKSYNKIGDEIVKMDELGKFAPEARTFIARKFEIITQKITKQLESEK